MLYYSHINEDSTIERLLLRQGDFPVVIAVAGSGERVLALMDNENVRKIIAVDVNPEALHLLQLKITILENFSLADYLAFNGHDNEGNNLRDDSFEKIKRFLAEDCRTYWHGKNKHIKEGVLNAGHFERFLKHIRPLLNAFLGKKFLRLLSNPDQKLSLIQQVKWKLTSWLFSQKWVYKLLGNKDIAFTGKDAKVMYIPAALNHLINEGKMHTSYITHLIFKGHLRGMAETHLPVSLQKDVLIRIRQRLLKKEISISYHLDDLLHFIRHYHGKRFFCSASDILSFEDQDYLKKLLENALAEPGNCLVARSFLRNRLSATQLNKLSNGYCSEFFNESSGMYQVISFKN